MNMDLKHDSDIGFYHIFMRNGALNKISETLIFMKLGWVLVQLLQYLHYLKNDELLYCTIHLELAIFFHLL